MTRIEHHTAMLERSARTLSYKVHTGNNSINSKYDNTVGASYGSDKISTGVHLVDLKLRLPKQLFHPYGSGTDAMSTATL
jgi:hypothetical protein